MNNGLWDKQRVRNVVGQSIDGGGIQNDYRKEDKQRL